MRNIEEQEDFHRDEIIISGFSSGIAQSARLRPADFGEVQEIARTLMVALIDLSDDRKWSLSTTERYLTALKSYCRYLSMHGYASRFKLAAEDGWLALLHDKWEQAMSDSHPGSGVPHKNSAAVCVLISHVHQEFFAVGELTLARARSGSAIRRPSNPPLLEFSNAERISLRDAGQSDVRSMERRLRTGAELLAEGSDPRDRGWNSIENLLWFLNEGLLTTGDLRKNVDYKTLTWPSTVAGSETYAKSFPWQNTMRSLLALLGPVQQDLLAFEVLMLQDTGWSPEELRNLQISEWTDSPDGRLYLKHKPRAHKSSYQMVSNTGGAWTMNALMDRWLTATGYIRDRAPGRSANFAFVVGRTYENASGWLVDRRPLSTYSFGGWINDKALEISVPHDLRRIRKTTKLVRTLKAGTLSGAARDDHSAEVFAKHYLPTTTIHVVAPRVLEHATDRVLARAAELTAGGPTVVNCTASEAAKDERQSETVRSAGLAEQSASSLDRRLLPVTCKDITDSPFAGPGTLCPERIRQCFSCPNSVVFEDHLPRVLSFMGRIEEVRAELSPPDFIERYGQTYSNVTAVLEAFPDGVIRKARERMESEGLIFPLEMRISYG